MNQRFNLASITAALIGAGITQSVRIEQRSDSPEAEQLKRRTTRLNYDQQKAVFEAAEAKRQRKCAKRLADAGMPSVDIL